MVSEQEQETGFEVAGEFYKWTVTDHAKDLMLIDRFTQMPAHEFFQSLEDGLDRGRGPILLAMIATSIRAKHKDWSVERIARQVMDLSMSDVSWVGEEDDEGDEVPPDEPVEAPAEPAPKEESGSTSSET